MRVPVHPGNNPTLIRTRNSDGGRRPAAFIHILPIVTAFSLSPPLRLRQAPPGLILYRWRIVDDGIVERRSTVIEHGILRLSLFITLRMGYNRCATAACRRSITFRYQNACRFVEIYERWDLYSKRTRRFIGSLDLCRTQRLTAPSRRPWTINPLGFAKKFLFVSF